jgi:hypothetical protein
LGTGPWSLAVIIALGDHKTISSKVGKPLQASLSGRYTTYVTCPLPKVKEERPLAA